LKKLIIAAAAGVLVLTAAILWSCRYHFERDRWQIIRLNRFTGQVCYSQKDGSWNSSSHPEGFPLSAQAQPDADPFAEFRPVRKPPKNACE
jgi:hypothetical protein